MNSTHGKWRGILALGMAALLSPAHAQHWESAGIPNFMIYPSFCYTDTVHDALYTAANQPLTIESHSYYPLYRYHGGQWDTLGLFGNGLRTAIVYHDTLIIGGGFQSVYDQPIQWIACYAGGEWHPYGLIAGNNDAASISRLRIIDGELYALGAFAFADGQFCNGIAKRVGGHWEPVGTLPPFSGDGSAWFLDAIRYQGQLVVSGNFTTADQNVHDIMAFDGTSWLPFCQCMNGGFDNGGVMTIYQGELYLGGRYYFGPGNVGQGLMRWDGAQWHFVGQPGGGLQLYDCSDQYPPTVYGFEQRDGMLIVAGGFFFADHLPANGIATWDGSQWCSLGGEPEDLVSCLTFYHDSLYIGCGQHADGEVVNGLARFIGDSYQEECAATGIQGIIHDAGLHILSPRTGAFALGGLAEGRHYLQVFDVRGRLILDQLVSSIAGRTGEVNLFAQPSALYLIRVDGTLAAKFIPVQ